MSNHRQAARGLTAALCVLGSATAVAAPAAEPCAGPWRIVRDEVVRSDIDRSGWVEKRPGLAIDAEGRVLAAIGLRTENEWHAEIVERGVSGTWGTVDRWPNVANVELASNLAGQVQAVAGEPPSTVALRPLIAGKLGAATRVDGSMRFGPAAAVDGEGVVHFVSWGASPGRPASGSHDTLKYANSSAKWRLSELVRDPGISDPFAIAAGQRGAGIVYATHADRWQLRFVEPGGTPRTLRAFDDRLSNSLSLAITGGGPVVAVEHRGALLVSTRTASEWSERVIATSDQPPSLDRLCTGAPGHACVNPPVTRYTLGTVIPWSSKGLIVGVKLADSYVRGALSGSDGASRPMVQWAASEAVAFVLATNDGAVSEVRLAKPAGAMVLSAVAASDGAVHVLAYERHGATDAVRVRYFALACGP